MEEISLKESLLFGSYFNEIQIGSLKVQPKLIPAKAHAGEISKIVKELIADGLLEPQDIGESAAPKLDITTGRKTVSCPWRITPKGKASLEQQAGLLSRLGAFKIIIATGGSTVHEAGPITQNINLSSFEQTVLQEIDKSEASEEQKTEAKSKLREFLKHPLLNTCIGAALSALLG